jgi:hypothetical protein
MTKLIPLSLVAVFAAVAPFAASLPPTAAPAPNPGVVFQIEVKDVGSSEPAQTITTSIEGSLLKLETPGSGSDTPAEMIFRSDSNEMLFIDHSSKSYMVMDEATIKQLASQLGAAMSQMQEAMKNMPPEQRAAMEEMMKGRGMGAAMAGAAAPTELRRTAERADHSGYPAVKYEVLREGRVIRTMWITEWNNISGFAEARPAFERMAAFMQEMMKGLAQTGFGAELDMNMYEHMREANGYPVLTVELGETGQPETETRLLSVTEQTIPASAFEPPAGYTRRTMGGMGS